MPRRGMMGAAVVVLVAPLLLLFMGASSASASEEKEGEGEGEEVNTITAATALTIKMAAAAASAASTEEMSEVFEPAKSAPSRSEAAAVQPVIGIGQRVKMGTGQKKDLGTLGYVLGLVMVVIIIAIGAGIVVGYVYKRGRDLKAERDQKAYEREMQRITLPFSAFTNQACDLVDENAVVVAHTNQTPVEDSHEGDAPLMGQAGTPGA